MDNKQQPLADYVIWNVTGIRGSRQIGHFRIEGYQSERWAKRELRAMSRAYPAEKLVIKREPLIGAFRWNGQENA